jgi:hypothetical protein
MQSKARLVWLVVLCGLLLAAVALLAALPHLVAAEPVTPAADVASADGDALHPTGITTVTSFVISNEAPGHLVDVLIAQGHGNKTLFELLGWLKARSGGVISNQWYNQVAAAPVGSEVFTATFGNYRGLDGGIEIAADGTCYIPAVQAKNYDGQPGYASTASQDGQFTFTRSLDVAHNIYTHGHHYGGGVIRNYYAFTIAWGKEGRVYVPLVRNRRTR